MVKSVEELDAEFQRTTSVFTDIWREMRASQAEARMEIRRTERVREVLAWLDDRAENSTSFGSHCHAYEIAARKLREALADMTKDQKSK